MTYHLSLKVGRKVFVLAVTDLEAVAADAMVQELLPPDLLPQARAIPSPPNSTVDLWASGGGGYPSPKPGAGVAPAWKAYMPLGMVDAQKDTGGRKWLLKVKVLEDDGILVPEALTTAVENIFAKASSLKVRSLVMPGLGLRARSVAVRQVAWLTLAQALRCLGASPSVAKFGIVLESGSILGQYCRVMDELLQEDGWTSSKVRRAKS